MKNSTRVFLSIILTCGLNISNLLATDYVAVASSAWNTTTTWSPSTGTPTVGDNVTIAASYTVNLTGASTCENLTIAATGQLNRVTNLIIIRGNFINNGSIIGSGTMTFSVNVKTISGSGDFNTNGTWNLNINTTIASGTTITKSGGDFSIGSGRTVTNKGTITVGGTGRLVYIAGTSVFINDTNASLTLNTAITAGSGGTLTASAPNNTMTFGNSTSYTIFPSGLTLTSGTFHNLAVAGGGTKTIPINLTINGNLTVGGDATATTLDVNSKNLTIAGNWALNGSGAISNNTGNTCTFNGATSLSGTNTFAFNHVIITGTLTAVAANMNMSGNFTNNGTYTHNNGTVTFTASTTVSGSSTSTFYNATISGTLTAPAGNMNIARNFINNGTFVHSSGTITFNGTTTLSGTNTFSFNNMTITGTLTAPSSANMNVAGNFANNGTFTNNNGTVTFNGNTTVSGSSVTTFYNVTITGTLTGHSGSMNIASNFTNNGTFTHNSGTINFSGGPTSISGTSTNSFNHIAIAGTRTAPASNMNVAGNFTVTGTFTHNGGTVTFNGTSAQTIDGSPPATLSFKNLTLNNAAGVTTNLPLNIDTTGTVTVDAGTFATGSNAITLLSTAGGTARIGNSSGSITGTNWIIQRHISGSSAGWDDISSSINGNLISDWDNELYMSIGHACPDGMAGGWHSVYYWNAATQAWATVTSCAQALSATRGYEIWLATTSSTLSETTVDSRGTPNYGNKAATLASGVGNWSLIGNPYASGIDWSIVFGDALDLSNFFQVYDETLSDYAVWDGDLGTGTGQLDDVDGGVLSANQGFWVQNSGASPTLTFKESHKSTTNRPFVRKMNPSNVLKMRLYSEERKNACESVIKIQDDASEFFDPNTDFSYLKSRDSLTPSLTPVTTDNRKVRVKAIPVKSSLSIPVAATFGVAGKYRIDFSGADAIYKYDRIVLEDVERGIFSPIHVDDALRTHSTYYFTQGTDLSLEGKVPNPKERNASSALKERKFILHFSNSRDQHLISTPIEYLVQVYPVDEGVAIHFNFDVPTNSIVSIYNILGQDILTREVRTEKESITLPIDKNNQLCFVKITAPSGTIVKKIVH